jgi:hypothetical protein
MHHETAPMPTSLWQRWLRWLASLLLGLTLCLSAVQAQPPTTTPTTTAGTKPADEAAKERNPPVPAYALSVLATLLILFILCKPSRRVT